MRRARWTAATGLGLASCALVPFVLVCCKGQQPDAAAANRTASPPASSAAQASQASQASEPSQASDSSAPTPAAAAPEPPALAVRPAPPPYVQPPLAPYRGHVPSTCDELDRAMTATFREVRCKGDADCTVGARPCGCSEIFAISAAPRFEAAKAAYEAKGCFHRLPPRPCATCGPPPSPVCTDRQCAAWSDQP
jgi:hypothetical protein